MGWQNARVSITIICWRFIDLPAASRFSAVSCRLAAAMVAQRIAEL
jgi:hypothetical protein